FARPLRREGARRRGAEGRAPDPAPGLPPPDGHAARPLPGAGGLDRLPRRPLRAAPGRELRGADGARPPPAPGGDAVKLDALAIGPHPDDVELGCGGTLALLARAGRRVGILHLTRGERGTRGTPEERLAEAERAAEALGASDLAFLDCGDGGLRTGEAEEEALIEVLRAWRPDLVIS